MALTYGGLGLLVVLTGSRFGSLNSSPWFNLAVAVIFVILALAMFDVLVIDFSRWRRSSVSDSKGGALGLVGVFALGAVGAVLEGLAWRRCLSGSLAAADLWARGNAVGRCAVSAHGMALPAGAGAGMAKLPPRHGWNTKRAMGVLILLMAPIILAWGEFVQRPVLMLARRRMGGILT